MFGRIVARQTVFVARSAPRSLVHARGVHIDNTVYHNMPFKYRNKNAFALKVFIFFATGLSIPFAAAKYQLWKAAGGAKADAA